MNADIAGPAGDENHGENPACNFRDGAIFLKYSMVSRRPHRFRPGAASPDVFGTRDIRTSGREGRPAAGHVCQSG